MFITLADIHIANIVHYGKKIDGNMPFAQAAEDMRAALGNKKFKKLIEKCVEARQQDRSSNLLPYEVLAERVKDSYVQDDFQRRMNAE